MWRILAVVIIIGVLIPLIWKVVNGIFNTVTKELSDEQEKDADKVIKDFQSESRRLQEEADQRERQAKEAKAQSDKLESFMKGYKSEGDGEEKKEE